MMLRLTRVELRRLRARRFVILVVLGGLVGALLFVFGAWTSARPMTPDQLAQAESAWEQVEQDWAEHGEEQIADCLEMQDQEAEASGAEVDFGCEQMAPQREWFFPPQPTLAEFSAGVFAGAIYLVAFLALLIGATFTAAEFSTGAISNWLTFEPRRGRVYASKLIAVGLGMIPVALLLVAVVIVGTWAVFAVFGLDDAVPATLVWAGLRTVALGVALALIGAALGVLLRHTAAVIGAVAAYGVLLEGMLRAFWPGLTPWTVGTNLNGWVFYGTTYYDSECTVEPTGTTCEMLERTVSFGHSAVYLLVLTAVIVAVGALVFRRRDVA